MSSGSQRRPGWRGVLVAAVVAGLVVTLTSVGLGLLIAGTDAAAGAGLGGGAAVVLTGVTLLLIEITERRAPRLSIPVFFAGFAAKLVLLGLALMVASAPEWMDSAWALFTTAAVVVTVQLAAILAFRSMRLAITPDTSA